jgi:hypothetical protein
MAVSHVETSEPNGHPHIEFFNAHFNIILSYVPRAHKSSPGLWFSYQVSAFFTSPKRDTCPVSLNLPEKCWVSSPIEADH